MVSPLFCLFPLWHNLSPVEIRGCRLNHTGQEPGGEGITVLEVRRMTRRGRGVRTESWRCYFLMQSAPRPVFLLKDHQAGSEGICETERTNCQLGSQSRMTAFLSPTQLPPPTATPLLLTPPASRLPHPPPVTITAWRGMIFQNSISQLSSPDQSGKRELGSRDLRRKSTIGFELRCLPIRHQVRITTRLIFMSRGWLKNLTQY